MRQAGVAPARASRRSRAWVDFGVDESWEPAPRRRRTAAGAQPDSAAAEPREDPLRPPPPVAHAFPVAYEPVEADYEAVARAGFATTSAPAVIDTTHDLVSDADEAAISSPSRSTGGVPGRRTVTIRGRGAERDLAFPAYRSANRPATPRRERPGYKPDRVAMWAVLLGICLVLVAATSSHAATLNRATSSHAATLNRAATAHHAAAARHVALVAPARR